jgi:hypothetical protein
VRTVVITLSMCVRWFLCEHEDCPSAASTSASRASADRRLEADQVDVAGCPAHALTSSRARSSAGAMAASTGWAVVTTRSAVRRTRSRSPPAQMVT